MELLSLLKYLGIGYLVLLGVGAVARMLTEFILGLDYGPDYWLRAESWYTYINDSGYRSSDSKFIRTIGAAHAHAVQYSKRVIATLPKVIGFFSSITVIWVVWKIANT